MKIKIIAAAMVLAGSLLASAQEPLTRSSFLGLSPRSGGQGEAVVVQQLHPQGTAQALGLQVGDTVQAINGKPISDFSELVAVLQQIAAGEEMTMSVLRDGVVLTLQATAEGLPRETGHGFSVEYGQLKWQANAIRTITYTPDTPRADGAAVMYIQGFTCGSIDYGMMQNLTLQQLLASYARAGFTVFKMEKPGVGDSRGELDCQQIDFTTENQAFLAGLVHFKSRQDVNSEKVFIFGHSLGVLHGSVIAEQGLAKGVMGYGGVAKGWYPYIRDIYSKQSVKYFGVEEGQAAENMKIVGPFLHDWLQTDKSWQDVISSEHAIRSQEADLIAVSGDQIMNRHYSFFRSIASYDFRSKWSNSRSHVLMMHGGYDIQTIESGWQEDIAALVNDHRSGTATAMEFERTDHSLMQYPDVETLMQATRGQGASPVNPGEHYNKQIAEASLKWMQRILQDDS